MTGPARSSTPHPRDLLLDDVLPEWHFREFHSRRVEAPPQRALAAVRSVTLGDGVTTRLLLGLRAVPARLGGRRPHWPADESIIDWALNFGFAVLAEKQGEELVVGLISQPWRLAGGELRPIADAEQFKAFTEPGFTRVAMNFHAEPEGNGTRLSTETRIHATDERTRRVFGRYWLVVRPGSGLIRRSWLRTAKRRAEATAS